MKPEKYLITVVCLATLFCVAGCNMAVKNTDGIKQYLLDQGKAEMLALRIKEKSPDPNSALYRDASILFSKAAGAGNGWTAGIVFDAKVKKSVDVSVEDYRTSEAGKALGDFLALDSRLPQELSVKVLDPVTITLISKLALAIIEEIQRQNDEELKRAVKEIETQFSKACWTTFGNTTIDWINKKYTSNEKNVKK